MKKIAIVGTAPNGRAAPFNDTSWEIWGCSARADYVTRADRWFELHRLDGEDKEWAENWRKEMRSWNLPALYMIWPEPDLAKEVIQLDPNQLFAKYGTYFFMSTLSYMAAVAIDEKPDEIGIWGVDMEYGTEYDEQRAGLRHFIYLARFVGIKVTLYLSGGLTYEPVPYPMWQDDPLLAKIALRREAAGEEQENYAKALKAAAVRVYETKGQLIEAADEDRCRELSKQLTQAEDTHKELIGKLANINGALEEMRWLRNFLTR